MFNLHTDSCMACDSDSNPDLVCPSGCQNEIDYAMGFCKGITFFNQQQGVSQSVYEGFMLDGTAFSMCGCKFDKAAAEMSALANHSSITTAGSLFGACTEAHTTCHGAMRNLVESKCSLRIQDLHRHRI